MVRPSVRPVLEGNPRLDALLTDDYEGLEAGRNGFWKKVRELRSHRFDTCLMPLPTERHTWMTFVAGIPHRISTGPRLYHILTFCSTVNRHKYVPLRHEADYCLDLVRKLGMPVTDIDPEVFVSGEERTNARKLMMELGWDGESPVVFVHAESGGSAPNWKRDSYLELMRRLLDSRPGVFIWGAYTKAGYDLRDAYKAIDPRRMLVPESPLELRDLISCMSWADAVVSCSTGPMHIACGLKVPTVSLFCPMTACSPVLWGPLGNDHAVLMPPERYCETQCPGDPKQCDLEGGVLVNEVLESVLKKLDERVKRPRS
jgi:ADP-heptose:LPS heptosyltransferase